MTAGPAGGGLVGRLRRGALHELRTLRGAFYRRLSGTRREDANLAEAFHKLYFDARTYNLTWRSTYWMGHAVLKCPLDLWLYQEILHRVRPAVIVETGTAFGGSALFLATVCDALGHGRVISIDLEPRPGRPDHPRITYVTGSSTAPETIESVRRLIGADQPVMVLLDSDHAETHVRQELDQYHPFVTPGSYLIVEDTNLNGHPVEPDHGPGPWEALAAFTPSHPEFEHDTSMDKFLFSFNPRGYLKRLR